MPKAKNIPASKVTLLVEVAQTLRMKNLVHGFLRRRQAFRSGVVSLFGFGAPHPVQVAKGTGQRNAGQGKDQYRTSSKP